MALTIKNYENLNSDIAELQNSVKNYSENINSINYINGIIKNNWDSGTMGEKSETFHTNMENCVNTLKEINKLLDGYGVTMSECSAELKSTAANTSNG